MQPPAPVALQLATQQRVRLAQMLLVTLLVSAVCAAPNYILTLHFHQLYRTKPVSVLVGQGIELVSVFGNLFCFENSYNMADNQTVMMHDEDPNFALATEKRANYTFAEDDALVDAVLHYKPMRGTVSHTWEDVHSELDPLFPAAREVKGYKNWFYTLLTKWKANEAKARWASGTAEQITAIKMKLQECNEMQREEDTCKSRRNR
ncbi:hypothetical protein BV898_19301 [Hypsibius exemplaris]|uniref:Uncharacterized protein n=1 Tax=Hypsibius exemplaris TaxID=2072580 RepID=A0A9X6NJ07_HYPEX|nr:hypothetical protein BV898_19301 [Hypsibius exemplaris]